MLPGWWFLRREARSKSRPFRYTCGLAAWGARIGLMLGVLLIVETAQLARAAPDGGADDKSATDCMTADYLPADAVAVGVLRNGADQVARFRALWNDLDVEDSSAWRLIEEQPQFTHAQVGLAGIAAVAQSDPWSLFGTVLGRELAVAIAPTGAGPGVIVAIIPADADKFDMIVEKALRFAGKITPSDDDANDKPAEAAIPKGKIISLYGTAGIVRIDGALLAASHEDLLQHCLGAHENKKDRLADAAWWKAGAAAPAKADAFARINIARIRAITGGGAGGKLPELLPNPVAALLLGGVWHTIRNADAATIWADAGDKSLHIGGQIESHEPLPESHKGFVAKSSNEPWPAEKLPQYLAEIRVNRRWDSLFSDRESFMTLQAAGEFVNFANTLTTLFGKLDVADEILPRIDGPVRLIMTRQEFSQSRAPTPRLPAFALVTPLNLGESEELPRRLFSGAQGALSLLNFQQAQNEQAAYIIDVDRYKDVRIVFAEYPAEDRPHGTMQEGGMSGGGKENKDGGDAGDDENAGENGAKPAASQPASAGEDHQPKPLNIRHNFAPAIAIVKNQFVIATSRKLLEQIIDIVLADGAAAEAGTKADRPAGVDFWTIDLTTLHDVLRDNRRELVQQRMLEQDLPRRRAAAEIDALLSVLAFGHGAALTAKPTSNGYDASLTITLHKPAPSDKPKHVRPRSDTSAKAPH